MYGISVLFRYQVVSLGSVRHKNNSSKKLLEFLAEMPKVNSPRIAEAQRQRQLLSKKSEKYAPSTVYLQVIGSGARGVPNTLYLFTDQKRYMFNCGECTQRLAHEHKVKLSRLEHIFITSKTWQNIGGLPGLSLTLQDVGVPNITLHGPEGLDELYNATRRFVIMKDMNVTMAKCSPSEDYEDNVMNVKYVLLGPHDDLLVGKDLKPSAKRPKLESSQDKEFEEFIHDETDYYKPETQTPDIVRNRTFRDKPKPKMNVEKADPMKKKTEKVLHDLQKKSRCSVAYICTLKKRLGSLDLAKCVEMGVKPGPMLGQLKNGHDVVLPDGTLVLSKDVKTPDDPGPVFIVLDVPDLSYLKEAEFSAHFDTPENPPENIPTLIVHYTPPDVFNHPSYRSFMSLFGPGTRHLVLNGQNACLGSEAVHRTQHKLHLLDPDIFPLLRDASVPAVWNSHPPLPKTNSPVRLKGLEELKNKIALAQFQNIINMEGSCKGDGSPPHAAGLDEEQNKLELIAGRTLTMFHLRPKRQLDRSAEPKLHVQDYIQETMDVDGFVGSLEHFRRQVDSLRYAKTDAKEYPKVVFLGTGSCIPSKTRNTSGIAVQIDENRSMLLDCGEGTFGQLVRFYGTKRVSAFLRTLKAIYISHLHADHHIGLIGVIQARRQAYLDLDPGKAPDPLYLLAPGQIYTWLSVYDQQFERIRNDFTLIPNQNLLHKSSSSQMHMTSAILADIGVEQIRTCYVSHCPNAFGVAIDLDNHQRVTYSGDTIPCEELVTIGENSTLLIHEATMEDELADEARVKMHSTTSQAIEMGKQMGARYTVLTHFSQRYARLPRLNQHILNHNRSVGIAFDNMQITMSDLELLPHMYAPLQLMFAEHCVEMELKAAQRARQRERAQVPPPAAEKPSRLRNHSESRTRKISPGCLATASAPAPRANYRESNASRLRQEIKGMTVTGIVRTGGSRSKSSSPNKSATNSQSLSFKPNSGTASPRPPSTAPPSYGGLPDKQSEISNSRFHSNTKSRAKQEDSTDKSMDLLATPRSVSETSSSSRVTQERIRSVLAKASSGYVVDTQSKTLATTIRQPISASEDALGGRRDSRSVSPAVHHGSCYGKPLVTSLNKKLTIMKNVPKNTSELSNYKVSDCRARSPARSWRTEHKDSVASVPDKKLDMTKSKSPAKGAGKTRTSNTVLKQDDKVGLTKCSVPGKQIGSTTSLKYNNKSPIRTNNKLDMLSSRAKPIHPIGQQKEQKSWSPEFSPSPSRQKPKRTFALTLNKTPQHDSKTEKKDLASIRSSQNPRSFGGLRVPSSERKRERNYQSQPFRDMLSERLKQQLCNDVPISVIGRPSSGMYSRSFKPQLEDIKSSYMLLNKKIQEKHNEKEHKKELVSVHKPKQFNEEFRKQQLFEIKKKFQSKHFFDDSKYDKIEGLNWISWK